MAVDFSLRLACEVRRAIPEPKLAVMVQHHATAEFALAQYRKEQPDLTDEAIRERLTVQLMARTPEGVVREVPVVLGKLFDATAELDPWRAACPPCRANVADRAFGCIGRINYPIAPEAERWLVDRLPPDPQHPALALLFKFLADLNVDGLPVDKARTNARMFSQRRGAVRHWGEGVGRRSVSSSQLLQMLLFAGDLSAQHAELYTRMLDLETVLKDPHPPSANIEQFKTFLCGVVMAGRLKATLGVKG